MNIDKDHGVTETRTLPDHEVCARHRYYKLNCDQFERLISRSDRRCEMCQMPGVYSAHGKLHIDHCGPRWAVRGLLCNSCNTQLQDDNRNYRNAGEYLANAWWIRECTALGFPIHPRSEPPVGSAIRNQWGVIWTHRDHDWWEAPTQNSHSWSALSWPSLFRTFGPHNLVPFDLRDALDTDSVPASVRHALENGKNWSSVRPIMGLSEPEPLKSRRREYTARDSLPWLRTPESTAFALRALMSRDECLRIAELLGQED